MTDWNKRAVGAKAFRWLPGMSIVRRSGGDDRVMDYSEAKQGGSPGDAPDLTDPATQGAILFGLLVPAGWVVWDCNDSPPGGYLSMRRTADTGPPGGWDVEGTFPEALARALELTPEGGG